MTDSLIAKSPALGQAWLGNWRARIFERLRRRGFQTITGFADSMPTASLIALAEELSTDYEVRINRADVAAEQITRLWRDEASHLDSIGVEHIARRILVGELRHLLPEGWLSNWTLDEQTAASASRLASAITSWSTALGDELKAASQRVFQAMLNEGEFGRIPNGWLPASAEDPILLDLFARYWREPL